jgi:hypothetical protein
MASLNNTHHTLQDAWRNGDTRESENEAAAGQLNRDKASDTSSPNPANKDLMPSQPARNNFLALQTRKIGASATINKTVPQAHLLLPFLAGLARAAPVGTVPAHPHAKEGAPLEMASWILLALTFIFAGIFVGLDRTEKYDHKSLRSIASVIFTMGFCIGYFGGQLLPPVTFR